MSDKTELFQQQESLDSDLPTISESRRKIAAQYNFGRRLHPRDAMMLCQARNLSLGLPLYLQAALAEEKETDR